MIGSRTALVERLILGMAAALLVMLAVLQFRWAGELSRAERDRLERSLEDKSARITAEIERQLGALFFHFHPQPTQSRAELTDDLLDRWQTWQQDAAQSAVLESILFVASDVRRGLSVLDTESGLLREREWQPELEPLRDRVDRLLESSAQRRELPSASQGGPGHRGHRGRSGPRARHRQRGRSGTERMPPQWLTVAPELPALISPVVGRWQLPDRDPALAHRWMEGVLVLVLDREWTLETYLPELAERLFDGDEFELAMWLDQPGSPSSLLFQSPPSSEILERGDVEIRFLRRPLRDEPRSRLRRAAVDAHEADSELAGWRLVVAHRQGSLDRAVAVHRTRNLAISAFVLLSLGATVVMLAVLSRRARSLRQQQTDFVTGITHELRTPIASISSLAENLADGIVVDAERTQRYGALIRSQGRRLAGMVDHVLEVAGMKAGGGYRLDRVDPLEVVRAALEETRPFADERGAELVIEDHRESRDQVSADERALRMAVVNLLTNAIKYGGDAPRVRVALRTADRELALIVEDSGSGIPADEQRKVFEPFFRGRHSTEGQIEGSGLGLALVDRIVAAHGGRLELDSEVGRGSRFSIILPTTRA